MERNQSKWYLINIKARRDQTCRHYIDAISKISTQDPAINISGGKSVSMKHLHISENHDNNGCAKFLLIKLISYSIVDPNAFYNKSSQEDVSIDWDSDVVANKKESEMYFFPSLHTLAIRKNSTITLNQTIKFFRDALEAVDHDTFDVNVVLDRDILDRILTAHAIYSIEADISFSNGVSGNTSTFEEVYDYKLREMQPESYSVKAKGSKEHPLVNEEDGMLASIVNLAERNGTIKARIQYASTDDIEKIDSKDHPRIIQLLCETGDVCADLYEYVKSLFRSRNE